MNSKILMYCLTCVGVGLLCGYLIWGTCCGDKTDACSPATCCELPEFRNSACCNVNSHPNYISSVDSQDSLIQYYRRYSRTISTSTFKDTIGYSVDTGLISDLAKIVSTRRDLVGFRLYPGMQNDSLKTLIISLKSITTGEVTTIQEDASIMATYLSRAIYSQNLKGYTGPCPTWCETSGRIIK